jgi:hypothetical protein
MDQHQQSADGLKLFLGQIAKSPKPLAKMLFGFPSTLFAAAFQCRCIRFDKSAGERFR